MKESIDETEEDDEGDRDDNDGDDNDNDVSDVSEIELLDSAVRTFINLVSWGCFFTGTCHRILAKYLLFIYLYLKK